MFFCLKITVTGKLSIFQSTTLIKTTTLIKGTALISMLTFFPPTTLIRSLLLLGTQEKFAGKGPPDIKKCD